MKIQKRTAVYGTLTVISYPGKATFQSLINENKCNRILRNIKRMKIVSPGLSNGFKNHNVKISFPGRSSILMRNNLILYKAGNILSVYGDPKRRIEKMIIKTIAMQNFKEAVDFKLMSDKIQSEEKEGLDEF